MRTIILMLVALFSVPVGGIAAAAKVADGSEEHEEAYEGLLEAYSMVLPSLKPRK